MPRSRTAKRAAGLRTPLEGKALTIVVAMVQPAPVKGEPTLTPSWREPGGHLRKVLLDLLTARSFDRL